MLFLKEQLLQTGCVVDNEYLRLYEELINTNLQTKQEKFKTQQHHSIPCACYTSRSEANKDLQNIKVHLLFKDHILAHYYLCLCAKESTFRYKMIAAVEFALGKSKNITNQEIVTSMKDWLLNNKAFQSAYEEYAKIRFDRLRTPEAREKARQALLGHETSEETRRKISEANRGRQRSAETRAKISATSKGRKAWNKGQPANNKGRKCIYNPVTRKELYIRLDQLQEYLDQGWLLGQLHGRGRTTGTRSRSIRCVETGEVFSMIKIAAGVMQIGETSLLQCLKGRSKTAGGYHWEYVN